MSRAARQISIRGSCRKAVRAKSIKAQDPTSCMSGCACSCDRAASILTLEDVVRRIAAECTLIDERGALGIRLRPAEQLRQYGEQFRRTPTAKGNRQPKPPHCCDHTRAASAEQVKIGWVRSGLTGRDAAPLRPVAPAHPRAPGIRCRPSRLSNQYTTGPRRRS